VSALVLTPDHTEDLDVDDVGSGMVILGTEPGPNRFRAGTTE
jgi:hypothetical protein